MDMFLTVLRWTFLGGACLLVFVGIWLIRDIRRQTTAKATEDEKATLSLKDLDVRAASNEQIFEAIIRQLFKQEAERVAFDARCFRELEALQNQVQGLSADFARLEERVKFSGHQFERRLRLLETRHRNFEKEFTGIFTDNVEYAKKESIFSPGRLIELGDLWDNWVLQPEST